MHEIARKLNSKDYKSPWGEMRPTCCFTFGSAQEEGVAVKKVNKKIKFLRDFERPCMLACQLKIRESPYTT